MKRTVVITGGTKGLGREFSLAFAQARYSVLALYSSDASAAQQLAADLAHVNAPGFVLRHDVSIENSSTWEHPAIHDADHITLIHNACPAFTPLPMHQINWSDLEKHLLVGVKGAWLGCQSLIRVMLRKKAGIIVNVLSSILEGTPPKGFAAYAVAKHALRGFTLALGSEYAARGIKVFSVSPGFMETPLTAQWDSRLREAVRKNASRITVPREAAIRLVDLLQDPSLTGHGEDYPL